MKCLFLKTNIKYYSLKKRSHYLILLCWFWRYFCIFILFFIIIVIPFSKSVLWIGTWIISSWFPQTGINTAETQKISILTYQVNQLEKIMFFTEIFSLEQLNCGFYFNSKKHHKTAIFSSKFQFRKSLLPFHMTASFFYW